MALLIVSGSVPIKPISDIFGDMAITANAETTTSTVNVGGTDYTLFTGFTATDGNGDNCANLVDGNTSTDWIAEKGKRYDFVGGESDPAFVEFHADEPFIPKGYVLTCADEDAGFWKPVEWALKAKLNEGDEWTTIHYSTTTLGQGKTFEIPCTNDQNNKYQYFRFEVYEVGLTDMVRLDELQFYGFENLTYTHLTVRAATCTEVGIKQECWQRSDGKYFSDENGTSELSESDVIEPMKPHTGVHHAADTDHIEYWQCSVCGKYFSDTDCTTEITESQTQVLRYLDENGDTQTLDTDKTTVTSATRSWSDGWYVVYDDVDISDRITVSGTVNLILCNGATLTASKGIAVGSSATFNVYAQSDDVATMGALVADATSEWNCAGIGGGNYTNFGIIVIYGGKITATGNNAGIGGGYGSNSGSITINGGIVSATAGSYYKSAGIGGGDHGYVASVTLNGGIITATGDTQYGGAGIGTGSYGGNGTMTITIGSGVKKLVATKGENSDCIGKQPNARTTVNVVFKDGNTTVTGDDKDAVFYDSGEGTERQIRTKALNHSVTMSDDVKANFTANTEYALAGETITLTLGTAVDTSTLSVNDGAVSLTDIGNSQYTFTMPDGDVTITADVEQSYAVNLPTNLEIVSATNTADNNGKYISGTVVTFKPVFGYEASNVSDGANTLTANEGVYCVTVSDADITITATVERSDTIDLSDVSNDFTAVDGDVLTGSTDKTVTIADGASITLSNVTINGGIVCEGTATITIVGANSTTGKHAKAGVQIGGSGTTLTITGDGSLTATGGTGGAGIGTSVVFANTFTGGNITIESGTVTAIGTEFDPNTHKGGDGIGTGYTYYGCTNAIGTVTIYDGINLVDASSIKDFANVVYMHGETDVTASKTDYFTIIENGNRLIIVQKVTPAIADVPDQTYTGSEITPEPLVMAGSLSITKGTDYEYSYTDNTNVGTAKVTVTFKGDYASLGSVEKEFNIVKATPTVTAPTANTLTYNDGEQELVTAGSTDFGKVLYSLDGKTYSEEVPKGTNAGKYTVYYKVEGSDNWNAVDAATVEVTIAESYTITWKNGDEILETDNYVPGGATPEYNGETPTKTADAMYTYSFVGWSPEISDVTGNVTYTAQFSSTAKSYTITYKVDGEIYKTESVSYGNSITLPDAPTREGYTFSGWQSDYTTMPAQNIEITGTFAINQYAVTYMVDGMQYGESLTVDHGTKLTAPEAPTKNGAIFLGWTADGVNTYDFETSVTAETTLTAMWLDASGFITFSEGYAVTDNTYNGTDRDYVGFRFEVNMDNSNYTVVQHGILYGMNIDTFGGGKADANLRFSDDEATALMDKVREFAAENTDTETTDWIEVYIGDSRDGVVYARGFIIVTDGTNNYLIYSDVQEGSYNSFSE